MQCCWDYQDRWPRKNWKGQKKNTENLGEGKKKQQQNKEGREGNEEGKLGEGGKHECHEFERSFKEV